MNSGKNTEEALPLATLNSPVIPAAFDGGLGYNDIIRDPNASIAVQVGPLVEIAGGDIVYLYWGGTLVATLSISNETDIIDMSVSARDIQRLGEGNFAVTYTVYYGLGGATEESYPKYVNVKFSIPGGHDPRPETPFQNENLALPNVTPNPVPEDANDATVIIYEWQNQEEGDVLTLHWGGIPLPQPVIDFFNGGTQTVIIPREVIEEAGGGQIAVTYEIRDKVNNWSLLAPYTYINVEIDTPAAPEVLGEENGVLDPDKVPEGSRITIAPWAGIMAGDIVEAYWTGASDWNDTLTVSDASVPVEFSVSSDTIGANLNAQVRVWYEVTRVSGGNKLVSLTRAFYVDSDLHLPDPVLPAPVIAEANGGVLDPADTPQGATVQVPAWSDYASGDILSLFVEGYIPWKTDVITQQSGDKEIVIPAAQISANNGYSLSVFYTVKTKDGGLIRVSSATAVDVINKHIAALTPIALEASGNDGQELTHDDYYRLENLTIEVPVWPAMSPGQQVSVRWVGRNSILDYGPETVSSVSPIHFHVPREEFIDSIGHTVQVSFTVKRDATYPEEQSAVLQLHIAQQQMALYAPVISDDRSEITVSYDGMTATNLIAVRWSGVNVHDSATQKGNETGSVTFAVPDAWRKEDAGKTVLINYSVKINTNDQFQFSQILRVVIPNDQDISTSKPIAVEASGNSGTLLRQADYYRLSSLTVEVPVYHGMSEGHTVGIRWVGRNHIYDSEIRRVNTIAPLRFSVPRQEFIDTIGHSARLTFSVRQQADKPIEHSATLLLDVEGQTLMLPEPAFNYDNRTVLVKYNGMEKNQRVSVTWVGKTSHTTSLVAGSDTGEIQFIIPAEWVEEDAGQEVQINYAVGDTSGAQYQFSAILRVTIPGDWSGISHLKPSAPEATGDNGRLLSRNDYYQLNQLTVEVPAYPGMEAGQTVGIRWVGRNHTWDSAIQTVTEVGPLKFSVPRVEFIDTIGRTALLSFSVKRSSTQPIELSGVLELSVEGQSLTLPQPSVSADFSHVVVRYSGMLPSQKVEARWIGTQEHTTGLVAAGASGEVLITIPQSWVDEDVGKQVLINYAVGDSSGSRYQFSQILRVIVNK